MVDFPPPTFSRDQNAAGLGRDQNIRAVAGLAQAQAMPETGQERVTQAVS